MSEIETGVLSSTGKVDLSFDFNDIIYPLSYQ